MGTPRPRDPGLQAERTQLAWERTAVGFLAIGVLMLLRTGELPLPGRLAVATIALGTTLVVFSVGRRAFGARGAPPMAFVALGCATTVLAAVTALVILAADR